MTHHYNADTREDDSIMVLANEQLERELLESQKTPLITCLSSQRVISRNLSWLRERLDTSKCFSRIVSKLVRMNLLCWTSANLRRKDALMEKSELDRQSFQPALEDHSGGLQLLFPTVTLPIDQRKVRIDAPWVSSSTEKDWLNHHRKCLHVTPHQ
jgi:hypothetical protein